MLDSLSDSKVLDSSSLKQKTALFSDKSETNQYVNRGLVEPKKRG